MAAGSGVDALEGFLEAGELFGISCHKEIVVLLAPVGAPSPSTEGPDAGRRPVGRTGAEDGAVHGKGLEMHDVSGGIVLDPHGNVGHSRPCRKQEPGLVPPIMELGPIPVDPNPDTASGRPDQGFGNPAIGEGIHGNVDPASGMLDEADIDVLKIFFRRVMFAQIALGKLSGGRSGTPVAGSVTLRPPVARPGQGLRRKCQREEKNSSQGYWGPTACQGWGHGQVLHGRAIPRVRMSKKGGCHRTQTTVTLS